MGLFVDSCTCRKMLARISECGIELKKIQRKKFGKKKKFFHLENVPFSGRLPQIWARTSKGAVAAVCKAFFERKSCCCWMERVNPDADISSFKGETLEEEEEWPPKPL